MQRKRKGTRNQRNRSSTVPTLSTLKIDKDCQVPWEWERDEVRLILTIANWFNIEVNSVRVCRSMNSGRHYYIDITPPIDPHLANQLQFLAGDDPARVAYNSARIESGFAEFNKLFERPHVRLRTIYCVKVPAGARKTPKGG